MSKDLVTDGWGYVAGGYGAIGVLVAGYVASVLRRRRTLARRLGGDGAAGAGSEESS
ncbi:MAG: CcmD family protein [Actinomycetota bacterium]|nr:CcmD family protein [Actinomycetota bacterium]